MVLRVENIISAVYRIPVIFILFLLVATAANAHHGWGFYGDIVEIEFTVAELKLGNPHDRVVATDVENNRWNLLLAPPARNRRFGFDESTLQVGDLIQVTGAKHSSKLEIKVHCINVDGENVYTYRYDNGKSSFERLRIDQSCE